MKFMLPWSFSEEAAAEKHMAQLQHNMWVTNATVAVLSIITGGGKWVEIKISADSLYQHLLLTVEKKFWRCVESGEPPLRLNNGRVSALLGMDGPEHMAHLADLDRRHVAEDVSVKIHPCNAASEPRAGTRRHSQSGRDRHRK